MSDRLPGGASYEAVRRRHTGARILRLRLRDSGSKAQIHLLVFPLFGISSHALLNCSTPFLDVERFGFNIVPFFGVCRHVVSFFHVWHSIIVNSIRKKWRWFLLCPSEDQVCGAWCAVCGGFWRAIG